MFSRNFMKVFPIRKYADITARTGSVNTDVWLHGSREVRAQRPFIYLLVGGLMLLAFTNFHTGDQIIGHMTRPMSFTTYQNFIPKSVLYPNLPIIEGFEAINKMREMQQTLSYEQ